MSKNIPSVGRPPSLSKRPNQCKRPKFFAQKKGRKHQAYQEIESNSSTNINAQDKISVFAVTTSNNNEDESKNIYSCEQMFKAKYQFLRCHRWIITKTSEKYLLLWPGKLTPSPTSAFFIRNSNLISLIIVKTGMLFHFASMKLAHTLFNLRSTYLHSV